MYLCPSNNSSIFSLPVLLESINRQDLLVEIHRLSFFPKGTVSPMIMEEIIDVLVELFEQYLCFKRGLAYLRRTRDLLM